MKCGHTIAILSAVVTAVGITGCHMIPLDRDDGSLVIVSWNMILRRGDCRLDQDTGQGGKFWTEI